MTLWKIKDIKKNMFEIRHSALHNTHKYRFHDLNLNRIIDEYILGIESRNYCRQRLLLNKRLKNTRNMGIK